MKTGQFPGRRFRFTPRRCFGRLFACADWLTLFEETAFTRVIGPRPPRQELATPRRPWRAPVGSLAEKCLPRVLAALLRGSAVLISLNVGGILLPSRSRRAQRPC